MRSLFLIPKVYENSSYLGYHIIGTKFLPPIAVTILLRGTCGTHKVSSPLSIELFSYIGAARNRTSEQLLKKLKILSTRTNSLLVKFIIFVSNMQRLK
jgi:hypothetical protein